MHTENRPIQNHTMETDIITFDEVLFMEHDAHVSVDHFTEFFGQGMKSRLHIKKISNNAIKETPCIVPY